MDWSIDEFWALVIQTHLKAESQDIAAWSIKPSYMSHMSLQVTIRIQTTIHTLTWIFLLYTRHSFFIIVVPHFAKQMYVHLHYLFYIYITPIIYDAS